MGLLLVTALAVAVVLIVAQISGSEPTEDRPDAVAVPEAGSVSLAGAGGEGTAVVEDAILRVSLTGLDPSRDGEFYALWLANADDDLLALAAFPVDASGEAQIETPLPAPLERYRRLEVSREPDDGDPARAGAVVLSGTTR